MVTNTELATRNDAIARHSGKETLPTSAKGGAETAQKRRKISHTETRLEEVEVVHALQYLLQQYIALLENPEHGGWSQEEDTTVRIACAVLSRHTV